MLNQPHVLTRRQLGEATAAAAIAVSGRAVARAAAAPEAQRRKPYPIYRAGGDHRALGRQHGEQARDQIVAHREYMRRTMGLTSAELRRRALSFTKLFEKHCPHLIEEIRGLAEGARIEFADALAANIRGALTQSPEGGCTAFVVAPQGATDGKVLIGQNSDMLPAVMDFAYVLHLKPKGKPEMLMWSFGGMIGYHGINDRGVGQFA
ncbi:MAG: C45 family autoproteolytic acyltransferase/hydrolase, partial [Pirellulaceae bacterium]|nr:C45 family autoproteolytic acyltransferase/hydrolase [Pirellulaceae bacterium]